MNPQWWIFTGLLGAVIVLDLWQRRLDRRRIAELERHLAKAVGIVGEKNVEIYRLETVVGELDDRNERLHNDQRAMRDRLPRVATAPLWHCGIEGHNVVDWFGNVACCRDCGRTSAHDQLTPIAVDTDVTRPYIREPIAEWERKFLEDKAAAEPWEELR